MRPQLQRNLLTIDKAIGKMWWVLVWALFPGFCFWVLFCFCRICKSNNIKSGLLVYHRLWVIAPSRSL